MAAPRTAVMAEAKSALLASHITVRRGDAVVVDDVSLELAPLQLHGLVGPVGAGKSTLLEAVAGFVPAVGDVVLGHVPLEREARRQHVFLLPEDGPRGERAFLDERALDVLAFAQKSLRSTLLDDVIQRLELAVLLRKRMRELSRGERRRVTVGAALLVPRGFLLLDEPFAGLELKEARALGNVLRTSTHEERAILVSLSSFSDAERLCDAFTLMSKGRALASGPMHELRARAGAHPGATLEEVYLGLA